MEEYPENPKNIGERLNVRDRKNALREEYRRRRLELTENAELKAAADLAVVDKIASLTSYRYAADILFYYPKADEINLLPLAEKALADGKNIYFPKVFAAGVMEYRQVTDLSSQFTDGVFGLREPADGCPVLDKSLPRGSVLMIIPALSVDREGYRLGYGKGYYDRYLSDFSATAVTVVYHKLLADRLPRGRYDKKADLVVTEKKTIYLHK